MTAAENLDHSPMRKGKYGPDRGDQKTPSEVAEVDPSYIVWAYESWSPKPCSDLLYRDCKADVAKDLQTMRVARDQDDES